jgi:hypothetical protein
VAMRPSSQVKPLEKSTTSNSAEPPPESVSVMVSRSPPGEIWKADVQVPSAPTPSVPAMSPNATT